jgi:hypothetical protein
MEVYAPPIVQGWVCPKWVVLSVLYAPPGNASFANYQNSASQGITTTIANSFSQDIGLSVQIGAKINVWGTGGKISGTSSSDYTQSSQGSQATTVMKSSSLLWPIAGVGDNFNPVNHNNDIILVWLNPQSVFSFDPNYPANMTWNGLGYDNNDIPGMDIFAVPVGKLNGTTAFDQSDLNELNRAWATNQPWPNGPGLTATDFAQILAYDAFANCSYSNVTEQFANCVDNTENTGGGNFPTPPPITSTDGRFTLAPGLNSDIPYIQAYGTSQSKPIVYTESTTNTTVDSTQTSHSQKQEFSLSESFTVGSNILGLFTAQLNWTLKESDTLNWTHTFTESLTNTTSNTSSFSLAGPTCTVSGNTCSPPYAGPPEFLVYQDSLYGTFMFYPVH